MLETSDGAVWEAMQGTAVASPPCTGNGTLYLIGSRDGGGETWGVTPSSDIVSLGSFPTTEVMFSQPTGTTVIGFGRPNTFNPTSCTAPCGPLWYFQGTYSGTTLTIGTSESSTLPYNPSYQNSGSNPDTMISPRLFSGSYNTTGSTFSPSGQSLLIYEERYYNSGPKGELTSQFLNVTSLLAAPQSYMSGLTPQGVWATTTGTTGNLDGYPYLQFPSSTTLKVWWHGDPAYFLNGGDGNLSELELHGTMTNNTYTFTQACAGAGSGTVTSGDGNIDCVCTAGTATRRCTFPYVNASGPVLTAAALAGSVFSSFSGGGCSSSPCTVIESIDTTVTAIFNQVQPSLIHVGYQGQVGNISEQ